MMENFRKKPVVIQAECITDEMFDEPHPNPHHISGVVYDPIQRCVFIDTLEGKMRGNIGDWIIRGVKGELYPCKPDIFAASYEGTAMTKSTPLETHVDKLRREIKDRETELAALRLEPLAPYGGIGNS